jgi:hypothetical protein
VIDLYAASAAEIRQEVTSGRLAGVRLHDFLLSRWAWNDQPCDDAEADDWVSIFRSAGYFAPGRARVAADAARIVRPVQRIHREPGTPHVMGQRAIGR